jgi:hypothetical protein
LGVFPSSCGLGGAPGVAVTLVLNGLLLRALSMTLVSPVVRQCAWRARRPHGRRSRREGPLVLRGVAVAGLSAAGSVVR